MIFLLQRKKTLKKIINSFGTFEKMKNHTLIDKSGCLNTDFTMVFSCCFTIGLDFMKCLLLLENVLNDTLRASDGMFKV